MEQYFEKLKDIIKRLHYYNHATTLMYWDMRTQMPKNGFEDRSEADTFFATEAFKLSTSDELKECLEELSKDENYAKLDDMWKYIVKTMKRGFDESSRIPVDFFAEYVSLTNTCSVAWEDAKRANDYSIYAPHLKKMIEMRKQLSLYKYPEMDPYDEMISEYEEGMDSATIDRIFDELKEKLVPLVKKILAAPQPDDSKFRRKCDISAQKKVERLLLEYIGFDFESGTTGETEHPFTLNWNSKDVRVTNHFREEEAIDSMFSAIHEGGHAIFEQNVDPRFDGTVAGSCAYLGIHESQSRFYENILGRNKNFWKPIYGKLQELLPEFSDISLDEFEREINHVRASYIRTMADEVTYCLHIIIRYEVEKAIFREGVEVEDLPKLWNEKTEEYLGITPRNDAEGILQDMHWSDGSFGYFPTYLLGSIYDGMFLEAIEKDLGDINKVLEEGRIGEIKTWLNNKIHKYGSTRLPLDTIKEVCGGEITSEPLIKFFEEKYTRLYNL